MADNYLERKMEELRRGLLAVRNRRPGIKPGSSRILIAGDIHGQACEMALQHRREGHRVAIFDEDEIKGKRMAYENGIRFHRVSIPDQLALTRELHSLLTAWRGIDTLIATEENCEPLERIIMKWKESQPIPDKSPLEIVVISQD